MYPIYITFGWGGNFAETRKPFLQALQTLTYVFLYLYWYSIYIYQLYILGIYIYI